MSTKPSVDATQSADFPVPYLISNLPDGSLPDMQDFGLERVGSVEGGWYSLCPIKAGRALTKDEMLSACLVHRRTGELIRVDYSAKAGKLDAAKWLGDFAAHVAASGKPITAGGWTDENEFSSSHAAPRLWCQADYRAFSTAPFVGNCVQVLACNDAFSLSKGQTLSLQVRDLKTQALHEQHLFTAEADSGWSKALCQQINRDSALIRAGVFDAKACTVTPGTTGNAFWGPQHAELCVTLTEVHWWASDPLDASATPSGAALQAWVYDAFSQRLLGHHTWLPSKAQRASGKWLEPWAKALAGSEVAPYMRIDPVTALLEQRGDGLRIFATLPGQEHRVEGPLLKAAFNTPADAVLVTVRHPGNQALLHHALFRPQDCEAAPKNQTTWVEALAGFIQGQKWPELEVKDNKQVWVLKDAELQVALANVGDGNGWSVEDYGVELLSADEWPRAISVDPVEITVDPRIGVTRVTIDSAANELVFRLDPKARDRGYRVVACIPSQEEFDNLREAYKEFVDTTLEAQGYTPVAFADLNTPEGAAKLAMAAVDYSRLHQAYSKYIKNDGPKSYREYRGIKETVRENPNDLKYVTALKEYDEALDNRNKHSLFIRQVHSEYLATLNQHTTEALDSYVPCSEGGFFNYASYTQLILKHSTIKESLDHEGQLENYVQPLEPVIGDTYTSMLHEILTAAGIEIKYDLTADEAAAIGTARGNYQKLIEALSQSLKYFFSWDDRNVDDATENIVASADDALQAAYSVADYSVKKFEIQMGTIPILDLVFEDLRESLIKRLPSTEGAYGALYKVCNASKPANNVSIPIWPQSVTDNAINWLSSPHKQTYDIYFEFPETDRGKTLVVAGHIGTVQSDVFWQRKTSVNFQPPQSLKDWNQISFLCEDYGNTNGSEIFDTTGHSESGVDPRTGLFHAHYPVASLQGLQGQGPVCELTLHYSAMRANEAGLGDGWAWRFSSVQVRDRLLTLADGVQVKFTDAQWSELGKGQALKLAACVVRSNADYSEFIIDLPSGRQEVLKKPAAPGSDDEEPNKAFQDLVLKTLKAIRDKSQPDFPTKPDGWQQWILMCVPQMYYGAASLDYIEAVQAWQGDSNIKELNRRIADYETPFVQLLPTIIESPYGEKLTLEWKRQKGQFLLVAVNSGNEALFKAQYIKPHEKTGSEVRMQVWPGSQAEKYEVNLELEGYLLRKLTRKQNDNVLQQVDCDYDDDPTLDRVLCSLRELDGSIECVKYQPWQATNGTRNRRPGLPRVMLHALIPGDAQQNQVATYKYDGDFLATDHRIVSVEYECGPHSARERHLLVHGRVKHERRVERFEFLRAVASEKDHWLSFTTRPDQKNNDKLRLTKGYRYTGAGDEFAELLFALKAGDKDDEPTVKDGAVLVERQRELLQWFFDKSDEEERPKLAASISWLLANTSREERDGLGRSVEVATQEEDLAGNVLRLHKSDEHILYRCYYTQAGDNTIKLNSLTGLEALPTLNCPFIPDYATAPVMAEYQCDPFGNAKGLRLFGYRKVKRGTRDLLELAQVVVIEGVEGQVKGDRLDSDTKWALTDAGATLVWRQRTTEISEVSPKTPQSKVMQWSVTDTQVTHHGKERFELKNLQAFEDNPTTPGITVRVSSTTLAGTELLSTELRSRHARRRLERMEQGEEVYWQYDALGRVIEESRYLIKDGATAKGKDQQADESTSTRYSADGKVATHTHKNQDISRSYIDGLQRTWRREWCKHGTQHFIALEHYDFHGQDSGELLASCSWDYLPGGQAVVEMTPGVLGTGPRAWIREQGGLDGPGMLSALQAQSNTDVASGSLGRESLATQDIKTQHLVEHGLDGQCLFQRSSEYAHRRDGTFEQVEHLTDSAGRTQLQLLRHYDRSGHVIRYERSLGTQTAIYSLKRDAMGRVTQLTRPDKSTIAYRYHGLSNHATELKVDGVVVATQKVTAISTLTSRTVGKRTYGFSDTSVTLPDKSTLITLQNAGGSWLMAQGHTLSSLTVNDDTLTLDSAASDSKTASDWKQTYRDANLPGRQHVEQTSPRAKRQGCRWQSLRGLTLASLRADGHWQRVFTDRQGLLLRTCQDHEEVIHRYDSQGRLQSRSALALKAGGRWQVLSEYDGFGQEMTRRFLRNGSECFKQCLTWRGDGRLASKTSFEQGKQLRAEHFEYDALDRLQKYECKTSAAKHCPLNARGVAVKAQAFTWDALNNLTQCITTTYDGKTQTEDLAYSKTDPTQLVGINCDDDTQNLAWNANGFLTDAAGQHHYSYNAAGQILKVSDEAGKLLARYEYDGSQRLAAQYLESDQSTRELRYEGDELIGQLRYDKAGEACQHTSLTCGLAQYDENEVRWLIDDPQVGVAGQVRDGKLELAPLLPFGEGKALEGVVNGYNGMRRDPLTGHYHAGNGYRSYDPTLRRYAQPDWLSPFGEGGINDYAHCPDPVNLHDPSGAIMVSRWDQQAQNASYERALTDTQKMPVGNRWRGLAFSALVAVVGAVLTVVTGGMSAIVLGFVTVMSILSFAFEVAAVFTADSNPRLSRALSIASVTTGVLSTMGFSGLFKLGLSGLKLLAKGATLVGKGAKVVWNAAKTFARTGLKGLKASWRAARGAGRLSALADDALGGLGSPGKLGSLRRRLMYHLTETVVIGENTPINFARSGLVGKVGSYMQSKGMLAPIMQTRMHRAAAYTADAAGNLLDSNILLGTINSSIDLENQRQALEDAEQPERQASNAVSVRRSGSTAAGQVPRLPSLRTVRHRLLPATQSASFW